MKKYFLLSGIYFKLVADLVDICRMQYRCPWELRKRIMSVLSAAIVDNAKKKLLDDMCQATDCQVDCPQVYPNSFMQQGTFICRNGNTYLVVSPTEPLMRSSLISSVIQRGDLFAVNLSTKTLTILPGS